MKNTPRSNQQKQTYGLETLYLDFQLFCLNGETAA